MGSGHLLASLATTWLWINHAGAVCSPQPTGISHQTTPDTASAFLEDPYYSSQANNAATPKGYTQVFNNTHASVSASKYRGYTKLDTYDVQECADQCTAMEGCSSFNIYFERDPSVSPDSPKCQNPSAVTNLKCAWYGSVINADDSSNRGQWDSKFQIVVAGSNGYTISQPKTTPTGGSPSGPSRPKQDIVTYDATSLFVNGKRVYFFSGSFHPFRLPVPGLWRDIFEKIRALGYNGVTFYIDWALVEGEQGVYRADGIFNLETFFLEASKAGIWLNARPGPYINAEVSGGGFPGWLKKNQATLRTDDEMYLDSTTLYMSRVGALLAKYQITNGGPIIVVQPENEYSQGPLPLEPEYFGYVEQQLRNAGIVVPLMNNQAYADGMFTPGTIDGADIYGYDSYPLGFDCGDPTNWGTGSLQTGLAYTHAQQSPSTPHSIVEFQGGSFDPWGGVGFAKCVELLNWQFESVFDKNNIGQGVKMMNFYMTYGGTNWGNLGHDGGYTSYDYGAAIAEDRTVTRQKYAEAKLLANSIRVSPAFLTAVAEYNNFGTGMYSNNSDLYVAGVFSNSTKFFVIRNNEYYSTDALSYSLTLPTSQGNITIPQLGGQLGLSGRESKILVTDFDLAGISLLYSSADIFTWQQIGSERTLVIYGDAGQTHEFAVTGAGNGTVVEGSQATIKSTANTTVVNVEVSPVRTIVSFKNGLTVHIVDRYTAYNYWVINPTGYENVGLPIVYMEAGYLVRDVTVSGTKVHVIGDLNATSPIEVIGVPSSIKTINFNGEDLISARDPTNGILTATTTYVPAVVTLPDLSTAVWKYIDGIPEIQNSYDDSLWPSGNLTYTNNTDRGLNTPTSLYAADYGFNGGSLLYRGHFVATGNETQLQLSPQGGYGFAYTLWLNDTYIGNWAGNGNNYYYYGYFDLPELTTGAEYVFTVLIDHMGNSEDWEAGSDSMKQPRGVMQYTLSGRDDDAITWKLTGNLGGTHYYDLARGPLNEGGMYAERQGFHLPGAPTSSWQDASPITGINQAGVAFYTTTFDLDLPVGYDIPVSIDFGDNSINANDAQPHRVVMFVNGYQFGKYVSNVGPQTNFPVPQGIWNYQGENTVAIELWAVGNSGASVPELSLVAGHAIQSGYGTVSASPQPGWTRRAGVY